jgi:hypothetical protein
MIFNNLRERSLKKQIYSLHGRKELQKDKISDTEDKDEEETYQDEFRIGS